jgi:cell division protein FtsZ
LLHTVDRGVSLSISFRVADDVLRQAVQGISDLITVPGLINLDFADVKSIMQGMGMALMGAGRATVRTARSKRLSRRSLRHCSKKHDSRCEGCLINITADPI